MGYGYHYYLKPLQTYEAFKYIEKRYEEKYIEKLDEESEEFYKTSFRLYLHPKIPSNIRSIEELDDIYIDNWEVIIIDWTLEAENEEKAYFWAIDFCKTY